MITVTGVVLNEQLQPLVSVQPRLEGLNGTTWVPLLEGVPSKTPGGNWSINIPEPSPEYSSARLKFYDPSGVLLDVVNVSSGALEFPFTSPPESVDVTLKVPVIKEEVRPKEGIPQVLSGYVHNGAAQPISNVVVRLFATTDREKVLTVGQSSSDGRFTLSTSGSQKATRFRIEFGPLGSAYEFADGSPPSSWDASNFPATLSYVVLPPPTRPGAEQGNQVAVSGIVQLVEGTPLPYVGAERPPLRVAIYELVVGAPNTLVGELQPTIDGLFSHVIAVTAEQINLEIVAQGNFGQGWEDITLRRRFTKAPETIECSITVDDDRFRTESEGKRAEALDAAFQSHGTTDPGAITPQDQQIVSEDEGLPLEVVENWTNAQLLQQAFTSWGVQTVLAGGYTSLQVVYALIALGYSRSYSGFAHEVGQRDVVEASMRQAVQQNLLLAIWIEPENLSAVLDMFEDLVEFYEIQMGIDSLASRIRSATSTSRVTNAEIVDFVKEWVGRNDVETFWETLAASPAASGWNVDEVIPALRRAIEILDVCQHHVLTVEAFIGGLAPIPSFEHYPASWTAEIGLVGWQALIDSLQDSELPDLATGVTFTDRRANWAEACFRRAEARFPSAALRGDMLRAINDLSAPYILGDESLESLKNLLESATHRLVAWYPPPQPNGEFDFGRTVLPTFFVTYGILDTTLQDQLRAFQRLYAVVPRSDGWDPLELVWRAGFRSALDISSVTPLQFQYRIDQIPGNKPDVSDVVMYDVWARARLRSQQTANLFGILNPEGTAGLGQFAGGHGPPAGLREGVEAEHIEALYAQVPCGCDHCQSVLSPAAYFVDMLDWLRNLSVEGTTHPHYDRLVEVRPDLPKIELDCENTNTAMPYVDLVVEILEEIVAGTAYTANADFPTGTEGTTEALLSYPEHIDRPNARTAYSVDATQPTPGQYLADRQYPRNLPYLLPLDELRTYLAHLGVPHGTLIRTFNDVVDVVDQVDAGLLAAIEMGAAPAAFDSFPDDFVTNTGEYWGSTSGLDDLQTFFATAQIDDFTVLLDLLGTRYLNNGRLGIYLKDESQLIPDPNIGLGQTIDPCAIENLRLVHDTSTTPPGSGTELVAPGDWYWARTAAFLRLQQWTGFSPLHLDKALYALFVDPAAPGASAGYTIDILVGSDEIDALHGFVRLVEITDLHPPEIFSWWRNMDRFRDRDNREGGPELPQYERVFLDPDVVGQDGATIFRLNDPEYGTELENPLPDLPADSHPALMAGVLGITEEEVQILDAFITSLANGTRPELNLADLWSFFRWSSFAQAADIAIADLDSWFRMMLGTITFDSDGFPAGPQDAVQVLEEMDKMRRHGLDVGPLAWVFGHVGADVYGLPDDKAEGVLTELKANLLSLEEEPSTNAVDEPTVRAALAELGVVGDLVDAIMKIVAWDWNGGSIPSVGEMEDQVDALPVSSPSLVSSLCNLTTGDPPVEADDYEVRLLLLMNAVRDGTQWMLRRDSILASVERAFPALTREHLGTTDQMTTPVDLVAQLTLDLTKGVKKAEAPDAHDALQFAGKLAYLVEAFQLDPITFRSWVLDVGFTHAPDLELIPLEETPANLINLWWALGPALTWLDLDRVLPNTSGFGPDVRAALRQGRAQTGLRMLAEAAAFDHAVLGSWISQLQAHWVPPQLEGIATTYDPVYVEVELIDHTVGEISITVNGQTITETGTSESSLLGNWVTTANGELSYLSATLSGGGTVIELTTTDPTQMPLELSGANLAVKPNLIDVETFEKLVEGWRVLSKLGVDTATALQWATASPTPDAAAEVRRLAKARASSGASWATAGRRLRDDIRRRQQAALFAYVRTMPDQPENDSEFYLKYLLDPKMDPCAQTSRLKLAISSVQTYVNQVMLGQVEHNGTLLSMDTIDERDWRAWRGSYRMWEAARKVFLFPENWLTPSLRVERSPEFEELEDSISQQGLDHRTAERALSQYLVKIMGYANPLHSCITTDEDGNIHLFARSAPTGDVLLYRRGEPIVGQDHLYRWTAWEKLPFPVPGDVRKADVEGENKRRTIMAAITTGLEVILVFAVMDWRYMENEVLYGAGWGPGGGVEYPVGEFRTEIRCAIFSHGVWSPPSVCVSHKSGLLRWGKRNEFRLIYAESKNDLPSLSDTVESVAAGIYLYFRPELASYDQGDREDDHLMLVWSPTQRTFVPSGLALYNPGLYINPPTTHSPAGDGRYVHWNLTSRQIAGVTARVDNLDKVLTKPSSSSPIVTTVFPNNRLSAFSTGPFIAQYGSESYLVTDSFDEAERSFVFQPAHHGEMPLLMRALGAGGLEALYGLTTFDSDISLLRQRGTFSRAPWEAIRETNAPVSLLAVDPWAPLDPWDNPLPPASEIIAFGPGAPHRIYNQEVFLHAPLRIAERLREEGQYADAIRWLRYVLDPSAATQPFASGATEPDHDAVWRMRPLHLPATYHYPEVAIDRWNRNPFDVHAIAEVRPVLYRFAVARQYVETLIAWGDERFSEDSMESIAEAMQLYHIALSFLGPRPIQVKLTTGQTSGRSYEVLMPSAPGQLPNPRLELEDLVTSEDARVPTIRMDDSTLTANPGLSVGYFCMPRNPSHLRMWDVLEDRLYKIRNCMTIDGVKRELPLFEAPIDPGMLVAAAAAGVDLADLRPSRWVSPHVRFATMLSLARQLASSVQRLSGSLQSALQSRDAEELTRLRQEHEIALLQLNREVRELQVQESVKQHAAAEQRRMNAEQRQLHYDGLIRTALIPEEVAERKRLKAAAVLTNVATGFSTGAAAGALVPQINFVVKLTGPPDTETEWGGVQIMNSLSSTAGAIHGFATWQSQRAVKKARDAGDSRRMQEWTQQRTVAEGDVDAASAELEAMVVRTKFLEKERDNHLVLLENAREVERLLRSRFTNQELFSWMVGELTSLHSSSFQLALEVARKAEVCFRRELGITSSNYVGAAYWNASRNGLLAADRLLSDLDRMEVAFVEQDRREFEITKHVSVRRLDPAALLTLHYTGACEFELPEALFDLDFTDHYYRRIKAVTITIPCVSGPNTSMHGTLTLSRSQVRTTTTLAPGGYTDPGNFEHQRWTEQIALSAGRDDSGLFTFDFRDAKYLPFEHRGAISRWRLALSGSDVATLRPQFDWTSISDVVLTVRYTARRSDAVLTNAAEGALTDGLMALQDGGEPMQVMLSFRRDAQDAWDAFCKLDTPAATPRTIDIDLDWDRLPYVTRELDAQVRAVNVVFVRGPAESGELAILDAVAGLGETYTQHYDQPVASGPAFGHVISLSGTSDIAPGAGRRLTVEITAGLASILDANDRLDRTLLTDIVVILDLFIPPLSP